MRRKKRTLVIVPSSLFAFMALVLATVFFIIRTNTFEREIRAQVVTALEHATGGRVEVKALRFHWSTLTAQLNGLIIHGTEPAGSPPLLKVASLGMKLKAMSLLKQKIEFANIVAERPQVYVLERPDGSTNIPKPHADNQEVVNELVNLAIERFVVNHGALLINQKNYTLDIQGRDLRALAVYDNARASYRLNFSVHRVQVAADCCRNIPFSVQVQAVAGSNGVELKDATLASDNSTLHIDGLLRHFDQPTGDLHFRGDIDAFESAQFIKLDALRQGHISVDGVAHFEPGTRFSSDGTVRATRLAYRSAVFTAADLDLATRFHFANNALSLNDAVLKALGGSFEGTGELDTAHVFQTSGRLSNVSLGRLAAAFKKQLPWSGLASGHASLNVPLYDAARLSLQTDLQIAPVRGAISLSGNLALTKSGKSALRFGNSRLLLPATQIAFHSISGAALDATLDTADFNQVASVLTFLKLDEAAKRLPILLPGGTAHFDGILQGAPQSILLNGAFSLKRFQLGSDRWDQLRGQGKLTPYLLDLSSFDIEGALLRASGTGHLELHDWQIPRDASFQLKANYSAVDIRALLSRYVTLHSLLDSGAASGSLNLSGSIQQPIGDVHFVISDPSAYGEKAQRLDIETRLSTTDLRIERGTLETSDGGRLSFGGLYTHPLEDWGNGHLSFRTQSGDLSVGNSSFVRKLAPELTGRASVNGQFEANVINNAIQPAQIDGRILLRNLASNGIAVGAINANVKTLGQTANFSLDGDLRETRFHGHAEMMLGQDGPFAGELHFDRMTFATLNALLRPEKKQDVLIEGSLQGTVKFQGALAHLSQLRSTIQISRLELTSSALPEFELHNSKPVELDLSGGAATIRSFELLGKDTRISVSGSASYSRNSPLALNVAGSVDLGLLRLLDANITSNGESFVKASITGTPAVPVIKGNLELHNASVVLGNFANGLTAVNGVVNFTGDRAVIESLTATSGGGLLRLSGFVSYGGSAPLVYHLDARADNVRLRYASISVTANTDLRLTGTSASSTLSGAAIISRIVFNANTDVGNVLSGFATPIPTPANQKSLLTGLHLDLRIESSPDLQIDTALSRDVEAGIDLRLRGTPDQPVLLGSISANQGDVRAFGSRYSINRGEISFINTGKIEPVLDLDLQTQARGITIDVTISGTLNRLNIAYRSDPPLQPRDIIALLTVGRTPQEASNVQTTQRATDTNALQSGASSVLGQAMVPASGLSKLFGVTNIKLDPLVQGISNTIQSRLTLEQQVSRAITVTYVTNLEQTSEQIFRVEWSINPQYSIVAVRDDNGEFGIDIQYKKRFK